MVSPSARQLDFRLLRDVDYVAEIANRRHATADQAQFNKISRSRDARWLPPFLPYRKCSSVEPSQGGCGTGLDQRLSYSSWRRHQTPVSLRPLGARSSHWHMAQRPSNRREYVE